MSLLSPLSGRIPDDEQETRGFSDQDLQGRGEGMGLGYVSSGTTFVARGSPDRYEMI